MKNNNLKKILILGSAVIDVIIRIDNLPKSGDDIAALQEGMKVGGCAFNVSKILTELNCKHDLYVPVGKGSYAKQIKLELKNINQQVRILDETEDNGYSLSLVDNSGERTFISIDGIETKWKNNWLDSVNITDYDLIYVSGYGFQDQNESGNVIMRFLRRKKESCKIILDPGPRLIADRFRNELLTMGTILEMNESEALNFSQENDLEKAIDKIYAITKEPVIVTIGKEGTVYRDDTGMHFVKSIPVKAIDTIGAGDSHTAGFISAYSMGKDLRTACEEANRVASIVVQHTGCSMQ